MMDMKLTDPTADRFSNGVPQPASGAVPSGVAIAVAGRRIRLKWHKLKRRREDVAFTPRRLHEGLEIGASMEVDLRRHADHSFVCLHDDALDRETTGRGPVIAASLDQLRRIALRRDDGSPSGEGVVMLEDLAELVRNDKARSALIQLDLKETDASIDTVTVENFRRSIAAIADRCILSGGDWRAVSRLAETVPGLRRGFDPCADDTLAQLRDARDCLEFIAAGLATAPEAEMIYLDYRIILAAAEMEVDLVAPCHKAGKTVDAWTLNADHPHAAASLWQLIALQVDQITTDEAEVLEGLCDDLQAPAALSLAASRVK